MHYLDPSWQLSATLCGVLTVLWLGLTTVPRTTVIRSFAREFAVVMALLGLWQYVGRMVRTHSAGAMHNARQVQSLQNRLHLPSQLSLQHAVLPHHELVRALNTYYAYAHLNGMTFFLLWVFWRHRDAFRGVRNTVVGGTLISLLVQMIPVAPPRLLIGGGYVDTALADGQSVYGQYATGLSSQLTAMPSVHVLWAFILAWYIAKLGRGPLRLLGVLHLVVTVFVVVSTANHWWLDGAAAIGIALIVMAGQALASRTSALLPAHRLFHRVDVDPVAEQQQQAGEQHQAGEGGEGGRGVVLVGPQPGGDADRHEGDGGHRDRRPDPAP